MQILRSRTDPSPHKFNVKQISQTPRANQNHHHIPKNKLTDGYRKRLSGSRAIKQNVKLFPGTSVRHLDRFDAPGLEKYCLDGRQIRLYKPYTSLQAMFVGVLNGATCMRAVNRSTMVSARRACRDGFTNKNIIKPKPPGTHQARQAQQQCDRFVHHYQQQTSATCRHATSLPQLENQNSTTTPGNNTLQMQIANAQATKRRSTNNTWKLQPKLRTTQT